MGDKVKELGSSSYVTLRTRRTSGTRRQTTSSITVTMVGYLGLELNRTR